jgi:hypothetical protein
MQLKAFISGRHDIRRTFCVLSTAPWLDNKHTLTDTTENKLIEKHETIIVIVTNVK